MAPGSDIAAKEVASTWNVGPTEDVVQALMESLVYPLLPSRVSVSPSEDAQKSVAKQMHAVVLLYNYHHRKQKPELVFLDFGRFCKLATVIRSSLIAFMKPKSESEPLLLIDVEDPFSVTEKAIRDACDIAAALDASRDVPNIEGWPISKVAVLLIDSKKENCMLKFGVVTKGAWSPIEKELNDSCSNPEISSEENVGNKRKRNNENASNYNTEFLQLGYDAVKEMTGIDSSDLEVLESHVTYSLSKRKSAACFYMMQYHGSINVNEEVPLQFLVESLQGPVAEDVAYGIWKTTPLVEFYHMLPYVEFISHWLSGIVLGLPSLSDHIARSTMDECKEVAPNKIEALTVSKENDYDLDQIDNDSSKIGANSSDKVASENCDINNEFESSQGRKVASPVTVMEELKNGCDIADPPVKEDSIISVEMADTDFDDHEDLVSGSSRPVSGKAVIDDNVTEKFNEKREIVHSAKEETRIYPGTLDKDSDKSEKDMLSCPSGGLKTTNMSDLTDICTKSEDTSKKLPSIMRVYHHRRRTSRAMQNDAQLQENGSKKVDVVDSLKPDHTQCKDKKVSGDKGDVTNTSNQKGIAATGNQLAQCEAKIEHKVEVQNILESDELQNALALLNRKRQELYSQLCNMEDTLTLCEDNIARIRDAGDVDLARQCIKSIISENYRSLLEDGTQVKDKGNQQGENNHKRQHEKDTGLSEAYLPGMSPCQDLEYACMKNNWRLPRYLTESSDGKFISIVVIEGKDFKFHAKGGFKSKPREARDSAATEMIATLRNTCV